MRIGIIGGGISGLVAARQLEREHDVTVFEAADYIGGHTNTIRVELDGEVQHVDTGFIVFNERNYPHFCRLIDELGVAWQPTSMSFSVRHDGDGVEYNGASLSGLFAQRRNVVRPRFWRMVRDILRFAREAEAALQRIDDSVTVDAWAREHGYSGAFVEWYLVPLGTALWSSPPGVFRAFPMRFVIEFLANHRMLQVTNRPLWRVIRGGSQRYVEKLIAPFRHRIITGAAVRAVTRRPGQVSVDLGDGERHAFDHVVLACHADQALRMLEQPTATERAVLGAFAYQPNEAVLHTDTSVLPRRRRAWASWNAHVPTERRHSVAVTYRMNELQSLDSKHEFCVTLNDDRGIDPARVIKRITYHHPQYTAQRSSAQARHDELIDHHLLSYCGAYWGYGFHEDGVRSALAVAAKLTKRYAPSRRAARAEAAVRGGRSTEVSHA